MDTEKTSPAPLLGPVQLVVIGFPSDAQFRGDILHAFSNIRGRGVIRLLDLSARDDAKPARPGCFTRRGSGKR